MHRPVAVFLSACALLSSSAYAKDRASIASTSLCGDGYVLALAPTQISALSWQSRDPVSTASEAQKALPQIWDDPETLANVEAEIILFGPGEGRTAQPLQYKTLTLTWGEDISTIRENATRITKALDIAPSWVNSLDNWEGEMTDRATLRQSKPTVLYLSRSAGTAGPGTYVDTAIKLAGGVNLITQSGWHTPDPEYLISLKPDVIITSFFGDGYESVQAAGLRHKILSEFINSKPRIDVPGALWPCAGPGIIEATELIADGLNALP